MENDDGSLCRKVVVMVMSRMQNSVHSALLKTELNRTEGKIVTRKEQQNEWTHHLN